MPAPDRFAPRPVAHLLGELADALDWPRSRPARLLAGERAAYAGRLVMCGDEAGIAALDAPADAVVLLATPPASSDGRLGRRIHDPFAGSDDDVSSWRRAERVVLDVSLLLAGGRGGLDERIAHACDAHPPRGMARLAALRPIPRDVHKVIGYVPLDQLEQVRNAMFEAGAGTIGDYDRCSWSTRGVGTFRPGPDSNPTIGTAGEPSRVEEERFEVVVSSHLLDRACRAYVAAHPYEEPAYDVLRMAIPSAVGFGRIGSLGAGGGAAAWTALAQLDPELEAHGRVDSVPAGAGVAVHVGPLRDVLEAVLAEQDLALVVTGHATELELELLDNHGMAVLVTDRRRAWDAFAMEVAGQLTRALSLPVTTEAPLHFPGGTDLPDDADGAVRTPASGSDPAAAVFATADGERDFGAGTWRLHFDGGSRGNPGPAAYGWVLYDPDGEERESDGVVIGHATNNVAEWTGLLRGIEHALARDVRKLSIRGDSELVVKQVTGAYRVKNAALKPLAEQVATLLRRFDSYDVRHVYRDENARADQVANEAMDGLR